MLPHQCLVILDFLAVSLILEQFSQVFIAKLGCKFDELVVVAHLRVQGLDDVRDLVEVPLRPRNIEEVLGSLLAQCWHQVLVRCNVNVEPEAPLFLVWTTCADRDLVNVAEDGVHGVRVIIFEQYQVLIAFLAVACQPEPGDGALTRCTYSERAVNSAAFFEPFVGGAEYAFVYFDFPAITELGCQVAVIGVVVPADSSSVSECSYPQRCDTHTLRCPCCVLAVRVLEVERSVEGSVVPAPKCCWCESRWRCCGLDNGSELAE